jgi:hypothetical protein
VNSNIGLFNLEIPSWPHGADLKSSILSPLWLCPQFAWAFNPLQRCHIDEACHVYVECGVGTEWRLPVDDVLKLLESCWCTCSRFYV